MNFDKNSIEYLADITKTLYLWDKNKEQIACPNGHKNTYKIPSKELIKIWEKEMLPYGQFEIGCNVCQDFFQVDFTIETTTR